MAEKKKLRCYLYLRVSTDMQIEGYSLEAQEQCMRKEAKHRDMQIVGEPFKDEGKSGKNTKGRPAFTEMMNKIQNGNEDNVDYILVFKLSRFGRNAADVLSNLQTMQDFGVNLLSVEEQIDSACGPGKFMIHIVSAVAEIERENILAQTMAGREQKARDGKWNGGQAPFGYSIDKQRGILVINEKEAEIVKLIFERYLLYERGANGVARWLNNNGYRRDPRGNGKLETFSAHFVKLVLDNPVYIGKIAYGRRRTEKIEGTRNECHKVKQAVGSYGLYEGQHEAIIDQKTWDEVRRKREETSVKHEKTHSLEHEHVLSGILKCPVCGASMYGAPGRKKRPDGSYYENSKEVFYYVCKHRRAVDGQRCTFGRYIQQGVLNQEVEAIMADALESKHFAQALKDLMNDRTDTTKLKERMEVLQKKRREYVLKKEKRADEIDQLDLDDPAYEAKYSDLQRRLNKLYAGIIEIDADINEVKNEMAHQMEQEATLSDAYDMLSFMSKQFSKITDAEKKAILQAWVKRIEIFPEKQPDGGWIREIEFNFPVTVNGQTGEIFQHQRSTDETVVLMSRQWK